MHLLLVEDEDLIGLAGLPFATEVGRITAASRPLDMQALLGSLARRIESAREAFAREARRHRVQATSSTVRGRIVQRALEYGERGDILVLGGSRRATSGRGIAWTPARATPSPTAPSRVVLCCESHETAARTLDVAARIAIGAGSRLVVACTDATADREAALRAELYRLLAGHVPLLEVTALRGHDIEALLRLVRSLGEGPLVLDASHAFAHEAALLRLVGDYRRPIVLVR